MSFQRDGFVVLSELVLDAQQLDAMRDAMDRVYAGDFETGVPPRADHWRPGDDRRAMRKSDFTWKANRTIASVALSPRLGEIAAGLLQCETVKIWGDQLLWKPGGGHEEANIGWHQDYWYWRLASEPRMLTFWIALDDVDESNGCMQFIPGSHGCGLLESGNYFDRNRDAQTKALEAQGLAMTPISCHLRAGHASAHHCLTLHGSGPNRTERPRRSLAVHMMDGSLTIDRKPDNPFFTDETAARLEREGLTVGGPFGPPSYPQVWPATAQNSPAPSDSVRE
jgi:ectoine hydroxylase-related dioxygenase (phytanoyl-CoA dioxygenase family)